MKKGSNKKLEKFYIIGASVIVILVFFAYMSVSYTLDNMLHDSKIINISGRQRMFSQKLVKSSLILASSDENKSDYENALDETLSAFKQAHLQLKNGEFNNSEIENSLIISEKFIELDIYFNTLYEAGSEILALSRADSTNMSSQVAVLLKNEPEFLVRMDEITNLYDKEAAKKPESLRLIALIAAILIVSAQLLIGFMVILPAMRKARLLREAVQQSNIQLQEAKYVQETLNEELISTNEEVNTTNEALNTASEKLKTYNQLLTSSKDRLEEVLHSELKERTRAEKLYVELSEAQSKLIMSERVSSLGDLTSGIAYEVNNPLNFVYAGIISATDLVKDLTEVSVKQEQYIEAKTDEQRNVLKAELNELKQEVEYSDVLKDLPEVMKDVQEGAEKIVEIMKTLHEFTSLRNSEGTAEVGRVDINHSIETSIMLSRKRLSNAAIDIHFHKDDSITIVDGNKAKINEIILHLLNNAIESIENKGAITIRTKNLPQDNNYQITIEDNGSGIPSEITTQVFTPFFTTKNKEKHRGMGLTIVQNIATEVNGKITLESKENNGTKIHVEMPKRIIKGEVPKASAVV